ncbi:unannotated protein [freshwater metagenome]|uniref:Unannotated protein n=1 Tax=freshwater metagenome TaxID=449393 RepID=A0A6J6FAD4_9ZZZZ
MLFRHERPHVARSTTVTDDQRAHARGDLLDERVGNGLDGNDDRYRHAALARRTETCVDRRIGHEVEIGVWKDQHVVLCSAECLDALAVLCARLVNILSDGRRTDERDRVNPGVRQQPVDGFLVTIENREDAIGKTGFLPQFTEPNRGRRVFFGGLEDDGVSRGNGNGEKPHRHHGGEVEGRDDTDDAERLTNRIDIDTGRGVLGVRPFNEVRNTTRELNNLLTTRDFAEGIREDLAVLGGQNLGEFALLGIEQFAEIKEDRLATRNRGVAPFGIRRISAGNGLLDISLVREDNAFGFLAEGRVVDGGGAIGCAVVACAVNPVGDGVFCHVCSFF